MYSILWHSLFQFTHPGRGATFSKETNLSFALVSIHAPREGCDRPSYAFYVATFGFNSRTPGGVRQSAGKRQYRNYSSFNSRTPGGVRLFRRRGGFSTKSFNSRTPGGVRLPLRT